jgi:hypothetical protein
MACDAPLHLKNLLEELETLRTVEPSHPDIQTRKSEIFQSILQLFAANLQASTSAQERVERPVRH